MLVTFTDAEGCGVRVCADDEKLLEVAVWPFLSSDLENLKHPADIPFRDLVGIRIAHRNMGVGGENSWGMWPRPGHVVEANQNYQFAFLIEPYQASGRYHYDRASGISPSKSISLN
jgi:beta-galactosidase